VQYDVCLDCRNDGRRPPAKTESHGQHSGSWYKPEYSPSWEARDADANVFYVYLLKLDGGRFYAGQTRELRERLSEHRDSHVTSTAGQNPKLVWFGILPSRESATSTEVEIKKLIDSNPREIRRMVIGFKDLVGELDYN
jgi:predicted GIY-YIG superfamily endonuclease